MTENPARLNGVNHIWTSSGVQACRDVSLRLNPGSVHALVGENGAGKTTLGHILAGVRRPDSGTLDFENKTLNLFTRSPSRIDGIGLIRQRSVWPADLQIWEAAITGEPGLRGRKETIRNLKNICRKWGLGELNPTAGVSDLDAASLQRAELASALLSSPRILILDEPAAAWEEGRSREFDALIRLLAGSGIAVLLITHRIQDVFRLADRVSVMRRGTLVYSGKTDESDEKSITSLMFGSELPVGEPVADRRVDRVGTPALTVENASLKRGGRTELDAVSLRVYPGEIFAVGGLREEGLATLEDAVTGNIRGVTGRIAIEGRTTDFRPSALRRAGMRYIPSDKTRRGSSLSSTMAENMVILDSRKVSVRGVLHPKTVQKWTEKRRREAGIDGRPNQKLEELSGGNIQKVILAREFYGRIPVIVAADPVWGLDERSRLAVHARLRRNAEEGAAILLLATDLDEAMALGDRMSVMTGGRLSPERPMSQWTRQEATEMIAGLTAEEGGTGL